MKGKRAISALLVALGMILICAGCVPGLPGAKEEAKISTKTPEDTIRSLFRAAEREDMKAIESLYHPEAFMKDVVKATYTARFATYDTKYRNIKIKVEERTDERALVLASYEVERSSFGMVVRPWEREQMRFELRREDGRWLITNGILP